MSVLRTLAVSLFVVLLGVAALTVATDGFRAFTTDSARRISVRARPRAVPAVTLQDQTGAKINLDQLRGQWVVVDFIYTRCRNVCSLMGSKFARLQRGGLAQPLARGRVRLLSISFDRAHDGPPQLAGYLHRFDSHGKDWLAARPTTARGLRRLERVFGVTVVPDGQGGFMHNDAFEIVDPQGRLMDVMQTRTPEPAVVAQVRRLLEK